jgi:hypothetical protein
MVKCVTLKFDIVSLDVVILGKTHVAGTKFEKQGTKTL